METKTSTTGNCDLREANLHPAWVRFIHYCRELKHGEIDRLTIQDGVPVMAELTKKKVKFST